MDITAILTKVVQDQGKLLEKERDRNNRLETTVDKQQQLIDSLSKRLSVPAKALSGTSKPTARGVYDQMACKAPYWSLVTPLTLLSAWLILVKRRMAKGGSP